MALAASLTSWLLAVATLGPPTTLEIQALVERQIEARTTPGLAVGIVDREGALQMVFGGFHREGGTVPIDADTVFEIGSISKVFTTLLLAQMEAEGLVGCDDPVQGLLPEELVLTVNEQPITLEHLATHTSGLPRMPSNFAPADPLNPYADYDVDSMHAFLSTHAPARAPGGDSAYSNLGMGLLGHAIALRAGTTYDELLRDRICTPLGMSDTTCTPSGELLERVASAHDGMKPVSGWDIPAMAGAGDINSTLRDMLRFAEANLAEGGSPLVEALHRCHVPLVPTGRADLRIGLGWHVQTDSDGKGVIWHNGGTGGFAAFLGFSPDQGRAVVVLANSNARMVDALGMHLLGALDEMPVPYRLEPGCALDDYVGTYRMVEQEAIFTLEVDHGQLVARLTGQGFLPVFPSGRDTFTYRAVPARLVFERGDDGAPKRLVLHQNGMQLPFDRVAAVEAE